MLRDITLGQYYQTDSVIHRLDPRVKLVATMVYIVSLFLISQFPGYIVSFIFLAAVIRLSKVPVRYMIRGMRAIIFLLIVTAGFNLFLTPGDEIFKIWILSITRQGLVMCIFMVVRLVFLIVGSSVMTLTTTPNQLTGGMEKLFSPLRRFKVPVHEIAMMMSIALRFIPILLEETDKIMKAQLARGADFDSGGIIRRAKGMVPLLVPLFVSAFRRANDLALAMEARCYTGGEGRTSMKPLSYKKSDIYAYVILVIYSVAAVTIGRLVRFI